METMLGSKKCILVSLANKNPVEVIQYEKFCHRIPNSPMLHRESDRDTELHFSEIFKRFRNQNAGGRLTRKKHGQLMLFRAGPGGGFPSRRRSGRCHIHIVMVVVVTAAGRRSDRGRAGCRCRRNGTSQRAKYVASHAGVRILLILVVVVVVVVMRRKARHGSHDTPFQ